MRNDENRKGMCREKGVKRFFALHEDLNVSLTRQHTSPTGEEIQWRKEATVHHLQASHADTNHTEYSYIALYDAQRVKKVNT